jgi:hypothetical protein
VNDEPRLVDIVELSFKNFLNGTTKFILYSHTPGTSFMAASKKFTAFEFPSESYTFQRYGQYFVSGNFTCIYHRLENMMKVENIYEVT